MKRKLTVLCCCLLVAAIALATAACTASKAAPSSSGYEKTIAATRTEIWQDIAGGGAASASVAICDNGKMVYSEGFGMANRTAAKPVDTNTQFNIGSVSKMFVTMAVLQLCQDGKLALDQPVTAYLPEFTMNDPRYQQITVRMLLNHTSELDGTDGYDTCTTAPDADFIGYFLENLSGSSLKGDPGIISIYCNDGFTLAQALVEKVSGLSYADYLSKNILAKAGMTNTSGYFKANNSNVALNYGSDGSATELEYLNSLGAGGIASNALDLCKFGNAILAGKMNIYRNSDSGFTRVETDQYQDDGYFYGSGERFSLAENFGTKFLMTHTLTDVTGSVKATMIPARSATIDPARFVGKQWIAINVLPQDTAFLAGSTWVMDEFPGYVLFGGQGYYLLNALIDQQTARPTLSYTRDTMAFRLIEEQGQTLLQVGGFKLINAADVATLQSGEQITIGARNVCRKLPADGFIKADAGRMLVISPALEGVYDSLANGPDGTAVTAGSYVVFIGNDGDAVSYDYQV